MLISSPNPDADRQETEETAQFGPSSVTVASYSRAPRQRQLENEESDSEREQADPHMEVAAHVNMDNERGGLVTQRRTRTTEPLAFDTRPFVGASVGRAGAAPSLSRGQSSISAFPFPFSQPATPVVGGSSGLEAFMQMLLQFLIEERRERREEEARRAD